MTRDSGRSGAAGEAHGGSTAGESAGRNGIAQTSGDKLRTELEPMIEAAAKVIEPGIMAHTGGAWAWRQNQERVYARRILEAAGVPGLLLRIESLQGVIFRNCDPFDASLADAEVIKEIAAAEFARQASQ